MQVDEPRVLQQLEPLEPFNRIDKYVKASAKPGNIIAFPKSRILTALHEHTRRIDWTVR